MPQVRLTAPDLDGPNPAWLAWQQLPREQKGATPEPPSSIPRPIGTLIDCTANEAAILTGRQLAELVAPVAPATGQIKPPGPLAA